VGYVGRFAARSADVSDRFGFRTNLGPFLDCMDLPVAGDPWRARAREREWAVPGGCASAAGAGAGGGRGIVGGGATATTTAAAALRAASEHPPPPTLPLRYYRLGACRLQKCAALAAGRRGGGGAARGISAWGPGRDAAESSTEEDEFAAAGGAAPRAEVPAVATSHPPTPGLPRRLATPLRGAAITNAPAVAAHAPYLHSLDGGVEPFADRFSARGSRRKPPRYGPWAFVGVAEDADAEVGPLRAAGAPAPPLAPPAHAARMLYAAPPPPPSNAFYSSVRCALCGVEKEAASDACWNDACARFPLAPSRDDDDAPATYKARLPPWSLARRDHPSPRVLPLNASPTFPALPLPLPDARALKDARAAALIAAVAAAGVLEKSADAPPSPRLLSAEDAAVALGAAAVAVGGAARAPPAAPPPPPPPRAAKSGVKAAAAARAAAAAGEEEEEARARAAAAVAALPAAAPSDSEYSERPFSSLAAHGSGCGGSASAARALVPLYFNLLATPHARAALLCGAVGARAGADVSGGEEEGGGAAAAAAGAFKFPPRRARSDSDSNPSRSPSPPGAALRRAGFPTVGRDNVGARSALLAAAAARGEPIGRPRLVAARAPTFWQWSSPLDGRGGRAEVEDAALAAAVAARRGAAARPAFTRESTLSVARNKRDALAAMEELERCRLAERAAARDAGALEDPSNAAAYPPHNQPRDASADCAGEGDNPYTAPAARGLPVSEAAQQPDPTTVEGGAYSRHPVEPPPRGGAAASGAGGGDDGEGGLRRAPLPPPAPAPAPPAVFPLAAPSPAAAAAAARAALAAPTASDLDDDLVPACGAAPAAAAAAAAELAGAAAAVTLSAFAFDAPAAFVGRAFQPPASVWGPAGCPPSDDYLHTFSAVAAQAELDAAFAGVARAGRLGEVLAAPVWPAVEPAVDVAALARVAGVTRPGYPHRGVAPFPAHGEPPGAPAGAAYRAASYARPPAVTHAPAANETETAAATLLHLRGAAAMVRPAERLALIQCVAGALALAEEGLGYGSGKAEEAGAGEEGGGAAGEGAPWGWAAVGSPLLAAAAAVGEEEDTRRG
jgi:hypothetical protein